MRGLLLGLVLSCSQPPRAVVANQSRSRDIPVVRIDRAHPLRDCPRAAAANVFTNDLIQLPVTYDACLHGMVIGDSIVVNASSRQPTGRTAARRAIVDRTGRVLLHGTETISEAGTALPMVVALVDLDGDGKSEIIEEDEVTHRHWLTRIYKVYEDTIVLLDSFPHALEDGHQTCAASWTVEDVGPGRRALVVSSEVGPSKRPSEDVPSLFECLRPGVHRFTIENDRLVESAP